MPNLSKPVYLVRTRYVTLDRGILRSSFTEETYEDFGAAKRAMLSADLTALIKSYKLKPGQKLLDLRLEVAKRGEKGGKKALTPFRNRLRRKETAPGLSHQTDCRKAGEPSRGVHRGRTGLPSRACSGAAREHEPKSNTF